MKNQLMPIADKLLLRKRAIIEMAIIDQLRITPRSNTQDIAARSILWQSPRWIN